METDVRDLIGRIHAAGRPAVLALTGGGASAVGALLAVPGGSRTVLEAVVPYAKNVSLDAWLGQPAAATARPTRPSASPAGPANERPGSRRGRT